MTGAGSPSLTGLFWRRRVVFDRVAANPRPAGGPVRAGVAEGEQ
jgi:hypothetical protein